MRAFEVWWSGCLLLCAPPECSLFSGSIGLAAVPHGRPSRHPWTITSFVPNIHICPSPPPSLRFTLSTWLAPFMLEADASPLCLLCLMRWPEG